ncbi:MAG: biopolymer transporter ExbD [Kaiparowitsia implicata GSE-PSE-MK54-09C]|nr:biopolymer transporter ExbD [Kaiparowitsia implicata GSE-PSE-MK54-09C]
MKIKLGIPGEEARIELVPLIDVVFCILTFFILAAVTLTRQSGINVDLPRASTGITQMREMLIVSVDPIGQIFVEKEPILEEELRQELVNFQEINPNGVMVLYASRLSSYNDVVRVLDILRSVGGERVALATLPEPGGVQAIPAPSIDPTAPTPDDFLLPDAESLPDFETFPDEPTSPQISPELPGEAEPLAP